MIGRLRGTLVERRGIHVLVDCGGVGYEVTVSGYTLGSLPEDDQPVTLRVYTQAQENKIALYGFHSEVERELFDLLITVKKVGPSSAISILSAGAGPLDIAQMIAGEQTAGLTKLKGVGKKTAEMLVVELREKCELLLATWGAGNRIQPSGGAARPEPPAVSERPPILDDVTSALVQLGWRASEADKVVAALVADLSGDETIEELLRRALRAMPR